MEVKNYFAQDSQGNAQPNATCYLYAVGTETLVTGLTNITDQAITNPFHSDRFGLIQFKAPNGVYDLRVVSGIRDYRIRVQCGDLNDAIEITNTNAALAVAAAQEATASAIKANTINLQFPFNFVAGKSQYDVSEISGRNDINTTSLALIVEGTIVSDFTITTSKKFTLNSTTMDALADGAQMWIIVNSRFDDLISNFDELQDGFTEEFANEKVARTNDYYRYLNGLELELAVPYNSGLSIIRPTQTVTQSGVLYRPLASALPITTTSWVADASKFVVANDMSLRDAITKSTVLLSSFPVVGDGIANDFDAIKSAILAANGKKLVFDKAVAYRIDGAGSLMVFGPSDIPDGITIDFNGQTINWTGTRLTDGSQGDQFATNWGVFTFRGTEGASYSATITVDQVAPIHYLPEPASHTLVVGDCVLVQTLSAGVSEVSAEFKDRIINRAARLVRISGGNLYFDGRFEFDVPAGTTIKYTKLNTVKNINLMNVKYNDQSAYDMVGKGNGASCIVFEACEDSSAIKINNTGTPEHTVSILRSRAVTANGYANDPKETVQGGYFTQITQSSHVYVHEARGRSERHIVDVTASAYVTVERSGSLATNNATFTTHGAYEHDIRYRDCYGYMSFANSGATFGGSTRLVVVDNHEGANLNFGQNSYQGLSDATFNNCKFPSESYISLDGVQFNTCTFATVRLAQNSSRSARKNVFNNCNLTLHPESFNAASTAVARPLTNAAVKFRDSFVTFTTTPILSGGELTLDGSEVSWSGAPTITIKMQLLNRSKITNRSTSGGVAALIQGDLLVSDSYISGQALNFSGSGDQVIQMINSTIWFPIGSVTGACLESTKTSGKLKISVIGGSIDRNSTTSRLITAFTAGAELQLRFNGVRLANGDIRLENSLFTAGKNSLIYEGVIEDVVTKAIFPTASSHVGIGTVISV